MIYFVLGILKGDIKMDPVNVGLMSVLPPIIAIGLALITKEVISSLLIGIFVSTFTYSYAAGKGFMGGITTMFELMSKKMGENATMIIWRTCCAHFTATHAKPRIFLSFGLPPLDLEK